MYPISKFLCMFDSILFVSAIWGLGILFPFGMKPIVAFLHYFTLNKVHIVALESLQILRKLFEVSK